jgi:hypothetical protein
LDPLITKLFPFALQSSFAIPAAALSIGDADAFIDEPPANAATLL